MDTPKIELKSAQGVTIVELLIALTLLGVVIAMVYSLYLYGMTSFSRGNQQASKQQEARLIGKILSEEIRYAFEVEVLHNLPVNHRPDDAFILVQDGTVLKVENGKQIVLADGIKTSDISLVFDTNASDPKVDFLIVMGSGKDEYELASSIVVLNLGSTLTDATGSILRYRAF